MIAQNSNPNRACPRFVSVILAVRNGMPWIVEQLDALLAQKSDIPFEILVADNGSTDGTSQLVARLQRCHPVIRAVDAGRRPGQRHAQRRGVEAARGELLLFVDADDVCPPGWLDAMIRSAQDADYVAGAVEVVSLNDATAIAARPQASTTGRHSPAESLSAGPYAIGANMAVWRDVWDAVDNAANDLPPQCRGGGEDRDLSYSMRLAGYNLGFCAEPPVAYRLRPPGRATRRQLRSYGLADAALTKRYHDLGATGDRPLAALKKYFFLVPRALKARFEGDESHWSRSELAVALGRLEGSIRFRVLCL